MLTYKHVATANAQRMWLMYTSSVGQEHFPGCSISFFYIIMCINNDEIYNHGILCSPLFYTYSARLISGFGLQYNLFTMHFLQKKS